MTDPRKFKNLGPYGTAEDQDCVICDNRIISPYLLVCGHCFCEPCVSIWRNAAEKKTCPLCRGPLEKYKKPQPPANLKLRAEIEVTCFGPEGIDGIKEALRTAKAYSTAENQVEVRLVETPRYSVTITQRPPLIDLDTGLIILQKSLEDIGSCIRSFEGGSSKVVMQPEVVKKEASSTVQKIVKQSPRPKRRLTPAERKLERSNLMRLN